MKCIVLTGGPGERLWPLSRKNCPKQFIELGNNHSIFQNTIARNIPYCDEIIIVTNIEYRYLVENQLEPFQGLNYRCIYETEPLKTTAAITLACLSLQPSELVLVTPTNQTVDSNGYKEAILEGKKNAKEGYISIFVDKEEVSDNRYGYVTELDGDVVKAYKEKPQVELQDVYKNIGFLVFENAVFLQELDSELVDQCRRKYKTEGTEYDLVGITPISVEKALLEKSKKIKAVQIAFKYKDIRTLDDLVGITNTGVVITENSNAAVINTTKKAVVVNGVDDVIVVSTNDALYIGKDGVGLKDILQKKELIPYSDKSTYFLRSWGSYENLVEEKNYRVRRLTINPGKTIYEHKHEKRNESWTVIKGLAKITIDGEESVYTENQSIRALISQTHQISNVGDMPLVMVETSTGEILHQDMKSTKEGKINEMELGMASEPIIKLKPALKDYLWGGNQLKEKYGIESDLDVVAEAWELSAHPEGESVVATGRHKGLTFSKYIENVGKDVLGWKCSPLQNFPLLVKFIDARSNLSIQVHPDDDYALEKENQYGKNEMWYVVDSIPGSGLYIGFNREVDREEVRRRVQNNTITEVLNFYPTKPGDVFFIPSGTVHAICEGNLICEIQQSSNCTYRLYDYNRRDKYGKPRELHLEKALDVLSFNKYEAVKGNVSCKYFESEIAEIYGHKTIRINDDRFLSILCIEGNGEFSIGDYRLNINPGDSIFVPAQKDVLEINGNMKLAISHI